MIFPEQKRFSNALEAMHSDFVGVDKKTEELKKQVEAQLDKFQKQVGSQLQNTLHTGKKIAESDLRKIIEDLNKHYKGMIEGFSQSASQRFKQQKLRDEFNDSFIVFVYGKVKCGKSSLGNFIANTSGKKSSFFHFDKAGDRQYCGKLAEIEANQFEVKATEATNTIQGFKLSGLTWIDSPGLHSLTEPNEKLSKDYVAAADLVLYLTSSDSPCRASDLEEILRLIKEKNKTIVIVITKSDRPEEDEVNGELVKILIAKSPKDRKDQEDWCRQQTSELSSDEKEQILHDVFSISKNLAEKAINDKDAKDWQASNFAKFYDVMTHTITEDAVQLKVKVPIAQLKSMVNTIINGTVGQSGICDLSSRMSETQNKLEEFRKKLDKTVEDVKFAVKGEFVSIIEEIFNSSQSKEQKQRAITNALTKLLESNFKENIIPLFEDFNDKLVGMTKIKIDGIDFEVTDKFESKKIHGSCRNTGGSAGSGTGAIALGTAGAFAGSFFGPIGTIIGGGIGAIFGSWAGRKTGSAFGERITFDENISVKVGNNREEILKNIKENCNSKLMDTIDNVIVNIEEYYLKVIDNNVTMMSKSINNLKSELEKCLQGANNERL